MQLWPNCRRSLGGVNRDLMKEFPQWFRVQVMCRVLVKEHLCSVP